MKTIDTKLGADACGTLDEMTLESGAEYIPEASNPAPYILAGIVAATLLAIGYKKIANYFKKDDSVDFDIA